MFAFNFHSVSSVREFLLFFCITSPLNTVFFDSPICILVISSTLFHTSLVKLFNLLLACSRLLMLHQLIRGYSFNTGRQDVLGLNRCCSRRLNHSEIPVFFLSFLILRKYVLSSRRKNPHEGNPPPPSLVGLHPSNVYSTLVQTPTSKVTQLHKTDLSLFNELF